MRKRTFLRCTMAFVPNQRNTIHRADVVEYHRYIVTVETGNAKRGGTNEQVKLQLFGDRDISEPIILCNSETVKATQVYILPSASNDREAFSPGSVIEFSFRAPYVGNLVKIRVSHGDNIKTRGISWKLERLVVCDDTLQRSWPFLPLTWFTAENNQENEFVHSGDVAAGRRASTRQARRRSMAPHDDNMSVVERMRTKFDIHNVDPVSANSSEGGVRRVCFKLHWNSTQQYDLKESYMYLFGAIPALGNWDTSKALRMNLQTGGDGTWRGEWRLEMEIDDDYDLIEYQYLVIDENNERTLFADKPHVLKLSEAPDTDDRTVEGGVIYVRDTFSPDTEMSTLKELTPNAKNLRTPVKVRTISSNGFRSTKNKSLHSPKPLRRNSLGFISRGGSEFLQSPGDARLFISPDGTPPSRSSPEIQSLANIESTNQLQQELSASKHLLDMTRSELDLKNQEISRLKKNMERRGSALESMFSPSAETDRSSPVTSESFPDETEVELPIDGIPELNGEMGGSVEDARSESPEITDNEDSLVCSINLGLGRVDGDDADEGGVTSDQGLADTPLTQRTTESQLFTPPQYPRSLIEPLRAHALKTREEALEVRKMFEELSEQIKHDISAFEARQAEFVRLVMDWKERQSAEKDVLIAEKNNIVAALEVAIKEKNDSLAASEAAALRSKELEASWKKEYAERRRLFNEVQELRGNIRVFCRIRPPKDSTSEGPIAVTIPNKNLGDMSVVEANHRKFHLTHAFGPGTTQEGVYSETSGVVGSVLDGYNVCVFAYGQTGSGKTHTMNGPKNDPGVNYRALGDLFRIGEERADFSTMDVSVSMLEIYNETLKDLLYAANKKEPVPKLEIRQDPNRKSKNAVYVPNLTEVSVSSVDEVWKVMNRGSKNRAMHATSMNEHSSRSHLILRVRVNMLNSRTGVKSQGLLSMVDLAGSERVGRSNATGDRLKEAQNINKSLANLGDVFNALYEKSGHVPYRNSKLTHFLADSLGGDSKTLMFVNVSCDQEDSSETVSSLQFAQRVAKIELGTATKHMESSVDAKRAIAAANEKASENQSLQSTNASLVRDLKKKDHLMGELRTKVKTLEAELKNLNKSAADKAKQKGNERTDLVREIKALKKADEKSQAEVRQYKLKIFEIDRKREDDERRFKIALDEKERKLAAMEAKLSKARTIRAASPGREVGSTATQRVKPQGSPQRVRQPSPSHERPPTGTTENTTPAPTPSTTTRSKPWANPPKPRIPRSATVASASKARNRNEEDAPIDDSTTSETQAPPRRSVEFKSDVRRAGGEARRATSRFEPRRNVTTEERRASSSHIPRAATVSGRTGSGIPPAPRRTSTSVTRAEAKSNATTTTPARSVSSSAVTPSEETKRSIRPPRANTLTRPPQRNAAGRRVASTGPRRATTFTATNRARGRREVRSQPVTQEEKGTAEPSADENVA